MSNLSQFLGGGGGGGETHIVTDAKKLVRSAFGRLVFKTSTTDIADHRTSLIYNLSDHQSQVDVAESDTYATVLDIASSDGGYLHWVISNGINTAGESATIKITVDGGTPVELVYQPPGISVWAQARMFLGGGISGALIANSYTNSQGFDYWNSTNVSGNNNTNNTNFSALSLLDDPTNNVYGIGATQASLQSDLALLQTLPYQRLEFASSLKVEAKMSTYSASLFAQYAYCFYTLF